MNIYSRLFQYISAYRRNVIFSIISNILLSLFTVFSIPILIPFFQILFDRKVDYGQDLTFIHRVQLIFQDYTVVHGKEAALILICTIIIVVFFFRNLFRYLAQYFMAPVRTGITRDIRIKLFQKYLDLPISFYAEERKGDLLSRALSDVQEIEWSILNGLEAIFKSPLIMAGSIAFMLMISAKLTFFVAILIVFTAVIIGGISKSLRRNSQIVQDKLGNISSILEESISGLRAIKSFNAEAFQTTKFNKQNDDHRNSLTRLLWRRDLSAPMSEFLGVSVVTILLFVGTKLVFRNELQPEVFFSFVFAFYQIIEPAKSFSTAWYNIQKGLAAMDRVEDIINTPSNITEANNAIDCSGFNTQINFDHVSFEYPGSNAAALTDINFTIHKGESIALVGPSGGGKSTLLDLLSRFQDCTSGKILIDGEDIKSIKLKDLRALFGIVTQEAILFHDSVRNNILFGRNNFSGDPLRIALETSDSQEFVNGLSQGVESVIGDRGMKLSGGQKQRLTIARAVLTNPPIMLLDEATSSLDTESEKNVQAALQKTMKGRTSVIVAHRISTITTCDKILVIDGGRIVEMGDHTTLLAAGGLYCSLVKNQTMI